MPETPQDKSLKRKLRRAKRRSNVREIRRTVRPTRRGGPLQLNVKLRGRGGYLGDAWKAVRGYIPRAVGGALGFAAGNSHAGWDLGAAVSKNILGWGDYNVPWSVNMNSLVSKGNAPMMANIGDSGLRVTHREFIGPVHSSTAFSNTRLSLNPGISTTFPWLSHTAVNFQSYKLEGAVITFKSSLTNAVASFESLGAVMIACDTNAAAPAASSQTAMEQMQFVASAKPSGDVVCPIECAPSHGGAGLRYIRGGPVPTGASVLDFDHCSIQIATVGQPEAGIEIGRVYISYDVILFNPRLTETTGDTSSFYGGEAVATYLFGLLPVTFKYNALNLGVVTGIGTGSAITFPPNSGKEFMVEYRQLNSSSVGVSSVSTTYNNMTLSSRTHYSTGSNKSYYPATTSSSAQWSMTMYVSVTDPSAEATLTFGAGAFSSGNKWECEVYALPQFSPTLGSPSTVISALEPDDDEKDGFVGDIDTTPAPTGPAAAGGSSAAAGAASLVSYFAGTRRKG